MSELIITRKVRFNSAHRLHSKHLSAEQNKAVYGKCNNANGHGHEYVLTVALKGEADPVTGMVFDLSELSHILQETIHAQFDHKHLDRDLPYFQDLVSTAENIAMVCWQLLSKTDISPYLYYVDLQETVNNSVRYYGSESR